MNPLSALPQPSAFTLWPNADNLLVTVVSTGFCLQWLIQRGKLTGSVHAGFANEADKTYTYCHLNSRALAQERKTDNSTLMCQTELMRIRLCRLKERLFFAGQLENRQKDTLLWDLMWEPLFLRDMMLIGRTGGRIYRNGDEYLLPDRACLLSVQQADIRKGACFYAAAGLGGAAPIALSGGNCRGMDVILKDGKIRSFSAQEPPVSSSDGFELVCAERRAALKLPQDGSELVLQLPRCRSLHTVFGRMTGTLLDQQIRPLGFFTFVK